MRKVREILRLKDEVKLSHREVAESLGVSIGVVSKVVNRAALAGLTWGAAVELSEEEVEERLYGPRGSPEGYEPGRTPSGSTRSARRRE